MASSSASRLDERTRARDKHSPRARLVLALGPLTILAGIVWAFLHPWRMTILHPHGQGFWWLFTEPPIWVAVVGLVFAVVVAPGVVADLARAEENGG